MGVVVQVNPPFNNVSLPPLGLSFQTNEQTTLTDTEYADLNAGTRRAISVVQSGVADPIRSTGDGGGGSITKEAIVGTGLAASDIGADVDGAAAAAVADLRGDIDALPIIIPATVLRNVSGWLIKTYGANLGAMAMSPNQATPAVMDVPVVFGPDWDTVRVKVIWEQGDQAGVGTFTLQAALGVVNPPTPIASPSGSQIGTVNTITPPGGWNSVETDLGVLPVPVGLLPHVQIIGTSSATAPSIGIFAVLLERES